MEHWLSRKYCCPKSKQRFVAGEQEYELGGAIGDGAAGLVRKATRLGDGESFAVKFLAPDPKYIEESHFDDVASRFKREGERGAKLEHPHLIDIYHYNENEDGGSFVEGEPKNPFLLMEYARGKTLESYIRRLPAEDQGVFNVTRPKLLIAIQLSDALEHLHKSTLIHRDVKPANLFLRKGPGGWHYPLAKLGDFGVVKWGAYHASIATGTLTATSHKGGLGTMKYMSPEQAISPKTVTVRSDIYPLGITLFELFYGRILPSPHHVYAISEARYSRGTVFSKFDTLGYDLDFEDANLGELLLDMFLRNPKGRPAMRKVRGNLEFEYERRYGTLDWRSELY